ncbi:hypothetical protein TraAM80_01809 [Trypanosoma rangeli]|uniref:Uncharacterized protein n=1 Tax=Trypanosoma rangeli TaxID=5698 RepID=A0A422NWW2_TRYRA|nr:uncharacterized protein TraAM80_01809 [Trypanosoma rangeli]RNF09970.1 hypothetical protein TraAM80_01809 [Trypanosoma rangeli]|eukprot:RNF09970.1 hypothetical protein TraAM80_01809 [Trypanosoma rangeli]
MDNNTVVLSVVEDLIHWPLPPADPATFGVDVVHPDPDAPWPEEAPLTAGGTEDLDEEPRERQRARYEAVLRLPALAQALGAQWAKLEVVSYLLRCMEEEDAELSFVAGMALIEFATSSFSFQPQQVGSSAAVVPATRTAELVVDRGRPLSTESLLPVMVRMGASNDAGVRRFLVEVVIPMVFFGVPLERHIDLCDWKRKYLKVSLDSGDGVEVGDEPKLIFDAHGGGRGGSPTGQNRRGGNSGRYQGGGNRAELRCFSGSSWGGGLVSYYAGQHVSSGATEVWDPFQINLYANRMRSLAATFLRDVGTDNAGAEGPMMTSSGSVIEAHDYTKTPARREAFQARWILFVGLMESMLRSEYATTVSTAVDCISNIYSCIAWFECMERCQGDPAPPPSRLLRTTEELVTSVFKTTRTHVARATRCGAERPCEDLMMLLSEHRLIITRNPAAASTAAANYSSIALGCGGLGAEDREVWDLYLGGSAPVMHRIVRMSLLRSLPHLIDWTRGARQGKGEGPSDWMEGLSFFAVCDVFAQAIAVVPTPPCFAAEHSGNGGGDREYHGDRALKTRGELIEGNEKTKKKGAGTMNGALPPLESDACHDCGVAEAVLDGVQLLLDELLRPHTIQDFLLGNRGCTLPVTLAEKEERMLRLCGLYRDCIVGLATLPAWKTRWLTTHRLPQLTAALLEVVRRVGEHEPKDGPTLVEICTEFLFEFHLGQWSSAPKGDGALKALVHDEEEEVRCVVSVSAAGVFRALGQGMFCLLFPRGVVIDMRQQRRANSSQAREGSAARGYHVDSTKLEIMGRKSARKETPKHGALLSVHSLMRSLPTLLDTVLSCCAHVMRDPEERVRSGAAAGLSVLARTLSAMVAACDLHVEDLGKGTWLHYLDSTTVSLMTLLTDRSPTVQIALVSELAALLVSSTGETGGLAAAIGGHRSDEAAQVRKEALVVCLKSLSRHEVWRYRERYAMLLSEMCVKFLAPNSLAAVEAASLSLGRVHSLEDGLRENSVAAGRPSGVVVAEDGVSPLHGFAKEELLPLLVDVLFDKVKAVRDHALESLEKMCAQLSAARSQLQASASSSSGGGWQNSLHYSQHQQQGDDDDVFVNDTLWPLIVNSPRAMATYLSRSSLLRIAVRLGVDKKSILLPLLDQLGHDAVLNVRLVVAKELYGILAASASPASRASKVVFTEQEKNGVVLQLLRLLVEDKSADVRDEAAKALQICF